MLWDGSIGDIDNALRLLLIIDYIYSWAHIVYRPAIKHELETLREILERNNKKTYSEVDRREEYSESEEEVSDSGSIGEDIPAEDGKKVSPRNKDRRDAHLASAKEKVYQNPEHSQEDISLERSDRDTYLDSNESGADSESQEEMSSSKSGQMDSLSADDEEDVSSDSNEEETSFQSDAEDSSGGSDEEYIPSEKDQEDTSSEISAENMYEEDMSRELDLEVRELDVEAREHDTEEDLSSGSDQEHIPSKKDQEDTLSEISAKDTYSDSSKRDAYLESNKEDISRELDAEVREHDTEGVSREGGQEDIPLENQEATPSERNIEEACYESSERGAHSESNKEDTLREFYTEDMSGKRVQGFIPSRDQEKVPSQHYPTIESLDEDQPTLLNDKDVQYDTTAASLEVTDTLNFSSRQYVFPQQEFSFSFPPPQWRKSESRPLNDEFEGDSTLPFENPTAELWQSEPLEARPKFSLGENDKWVNPISTTPAASIKASEIQSEGMIFHSKTEDAKRPEPVQETDQQDFSPTISNHTMPGAWYYSTGDTAASSQLGSSLRESEEEKRKSSSPWILEGHHIDNLPTEPILELGSMTYGNPIERKTLEACDPFVLVQLDQNERVKLRSLPFEQEAGSIWGNIALRIRQFVSNLIPESSSSLDKTPAEMIKIPRGPDARLRCAPRKTLVNLRLDSTFGSSSLYAGRVLSGSRNSKEAWPDERIPPMDLNQRVQSRESSPVKRDNPISIYSVSSSRSGTKNSSTVEAEVPSALQSSTITEIFSQVPIRTDTKGANQEISVQSSMASSPEGLETGFGSPVKVFDWSRRREWSDPGDQRPFVF